MSSISPQNEEDEDITNASVLRSRKAKKSDIEQLIDEELNDDPTKLEFLNPISVKSSVSSQQPQNSRSQPNMAEQNYGRLHMLMFEEFRF